MNKIDFTQPGGFPLDQEVLDLLQDNAKLAATSALLGGDFIILKGCDVVGGSASNGVVVINGEILPFAEGVISDKVVIHQDITTLQYEDGDDKGVQFVRYATFGDDGVTNYLWADFKRNTPSNGLLKRVEKLEMMLAPLMPYTADGDTVHGSRLEWNRPAIEIPTGWIADDDPSIAGKMPVGYKAGDVDFGAIGNTGGSKTHTLTVDEMPAHTHSLSQGDSYTGSGGASRVGRGDVGPVNITTANSGGGQAHSILNPFRVVQYIIFVGV